MTADRWRQIEDIFNQAVEQPLGARAQFLHHACGSDAELRREVESLLACDAPDEELINVLGDAEATLSAELDPGLAGRRIGSYRLTRWLGNGGMGSVYLGVRDFTTVKNGHGMTVLSTPKGILSDKDARKEQVGGEALFMIW